MLNRNEKESVKAVLSEDAPLVAKALSPHFGMEGEIFAEKWLRSQFGYVYEGEHYVIPLHGKLDVVIDTGKSVEVFDYKTKQGMSVNEIKGETKNSNGSYFRQLVYYSFLIDSDRRFRGRKANYSLVFVSPDSKGKCPIITLEVSVDDRKNIEKEITKLLDSVWSGDIVDAHCDDKECEYCALRQTLKS
jgi:hypothetical protein